MHRATAVIEDRITVASFAALATTVAVAAALIGVAVGNLTPSGGHASRGGGSLTAGNISLQYLPGWHPATPPSIPGLELAHVAAVAPARASEPAGLIVGDVPTSIGSPLPPALLARLRRRVDVGVVGFGGFDAYRYKGVEVPGFATPLVVYSIPGQRSSTVVACYAADAEHRRACERMVATVDTTLDPFGPVTYSLAPNAAYARGVAGAVGRLDAARRAYRAGLRGQPSARQAALAGQLAVAYGTAGSALGAMNPPDAVTMAHGHLLAALRAGAGAYASLAAAARRDDGAAYAAAAAEVDRDEAATSRTLAELAAFGYGRTIGPAGA
jgi:hypothetical protein